MTTGTGPGTGGPEVAIVTGGSGGIGRAVCHAFASEGFSVVVVDVDDSRVAETVAELAAKGGAPEPLGLTLNVANEADMEEMANRVLERFGRVDVLITCAAVLRGQGCLPHPLTDVSMQEWEEVLSTNLRGVFLSNRAVLPTMIETRRGNVVNISSTAGRQGRAHDAPYCASKFAVIGLSEAVAEEVRQYGVRVQVVLPDAVDTPIWEQNGPIRPDHALDPQRVANLILYLVRLPGDAFIQGAVIAPFRTRRRRFRSANQEPGRQTQGSSGPQGTS